MDLELPGPHWFHRTERNVTKRKGFLRELKGEKVLFIDIRRRGHR